MGIPLLAASQRDECLLRIGCKNSSLRDAAKKEIQIAGTTPMVKRFQPSPRQLLALTWICIAAMLGCYTFQLAKIGIDLREDFWVYWENNRFYSDPQLAMDNGLHVLFEAAALERADQRTQPPLPGDPTIAQPGVGLFDSPRDLPTVYHRWQRLKPVYSHIFRGWIVTYDHLIRDEHEGNYQMDYPPLRSLVMTLWSWKVQSEHPGITNYPTRRENIFNRFTHRLEPVTPDVIHPMLICNGIAEGISAIAIFFLVWIWSRRESRLSTNSNAPRRREGRREEEESELNSSRLPSRLRVFAVHLSLTTMLRLPIRLFPEYVPPHPPPPSPPPPPPPLRDHVVQNTIWQSRWGDPAAADSANPTRDLLILIRPFTHFQILREHRPWPGADRYAHHQRRLVDLSDPALHLRYRPRPISTQALSRPRLRHRRHDTGVDQSAVHSRQLRLAAMGSMAAAVLSRRRRAGFRRLVAHRRNRPGRRRHVQRPIVFHRAGAGAMPAVCRVDGPVYADRRGRWP